MAEHSINFQITVEEMGWSKIGVKHKFINFLTKKIKYILCAKEEPKAFYNVVNLAIMIGNCLKQRQRGNNYRSHYHYAYRFRVSPVSSTWDSPPFTSPEIQLDTRGSAAGKETIEAVASVETCKSAAGR